MFDRLFLHIGSHKTATTSIQATLQANQPALIAHGSHFVAYRAGILAHIATQPERIVPGLVRSRDAEGLQRFIDRAIDDLGKAAGNPDLTTAILSSEDMLILPPRDIAALKAFLADFAHELHVIVYLRHPLGRIPSMQAQAIKTGHARVGPPGPHLVERYDRVLGKWMQAFGRQAVDLRVFDPANLPPGGPVAEFCTAIGLPNLVADLRIVRRNDSLSMAAALIASALNQTGARIEPRKPLIDLLEAIDGSKYTCDPNDLKALADHFQPQLDLLQQAYGVTLPQPELPLYITDRNQVFDDATLASLGRVLRSAASQNARAKAQIEQLDRQIAALEKRDQPSG